MLNVGLIDVDGHNFPNLALMKISAWHKKQGDSVEWYDPLFSGHLDKVYMSKVFSFTPDYIYPIYADEIVKGGSGYCISLVDGKEVYDKSKEKELPPEIEHIYPDYSIYFNDNDLVYDEETGECLGLHPREKKKRDTAYGFLSRGCPRGCSFCHVEAKEGRASRKVADLSEFWRGQKNIELLDPNILACKDRMELLDQLIESNAIVNFNQGLDIRLTNEEVAEKLGKMRIKRLHFAWDNPKQDLTPYFKRFSEAYKRKSSATKVVYVLVNFNSTMEENLYRIYTLRDLGYDPYVMVYDKPNAPKEIKDLQRWVNSRFIFRSCKNFEDYKKGN